jgi:phosphoribosylformimino-5-aminoimidazole carboxamide ribotide isomerase
VRIIPAIDIINGQCVRLTQGNYAAKTIYATDPVAVAQSFEAQGAKYLHLVDLDGAKARKIVNHAVLENIAKATNLTIDFGGGIQSDEDIQRAFDSGASQITGGSIAVKNPDLFLSWLAKYGAEKIILGADVKDEQIAVSGWEETTTLGLYDFLGKYTKAGIKYVVCTDIQKDGLLQGASTELYKYILAEFPALHLIASGGVSSTQDLLGLEKIGVDGAIIGKALYEQRLTWQDLAYFLA